MNNADVNNWIGFWSVAEMLKSRENWYAKHSWVFLSLHLEMRIHVKIYLLRTQGLATAARLLHYESSIKDGIGLNTMMLQTITVQGYASKTCYNRTHYQTMTDVEPWKENMLPNHQHGVNSLVPLSCNPTRYMVQTLRLRYRQHCQSSWKFSAKPSLCPLQ